ncbi:TPA: hypothetical protein H1016_00775 [archaeon]|uniref:Uncharacterized protein n=1 Tax=Candidatus Naiadarchaeum limnaeum TaxID=2756139 RepID=A0A832V2Z4_9ARCH|nr:hypothetical protein [Candidatus Naiadarchaeum limnaeum]
MKNIKSRFFKNKKAASILIEQIFVLMFGILILVMVITVFTTLRAKSFDFVASSQFGSVASYVHNGVIIAEQNMRVANTGKVFLDLPDKVGDKPYRIEIKNNFINVTDLGGALNTSVALFNINATVSGNASSGGGGRIFLFYNRTANSITLQAEERVIST